VLRDLLGDFRVNKLKRKAFAIRKNDKEEATFTIYLSLVSLSGLYACPL